MLGDECRATFGEGSHYDLDGYRAQFTRFSLQEMAHRASGTHKAAQCLGAENLKESDMLNIRNKMIMSIAVMAFSAVHPNVALSKTVGLAGSDQTKSLDCAGGWARIAGANNHVTLTGKCAGLTIYGSRNTVTAAFQTNARVRFAGSNNAVTWTTPDAREPRVLPAAATPASRAGLQS